MKQSLLLLTMILGYNANAQWKITGNAGTNSTINFVGTTDQEHLVFRVENKERMRLNLSGRITFHGMNTAGSVWDRNLLLGGGSDNVTGLYNTVLGMGALTINDGSESNTAMGNNVMSLLKEGNNNTGMGSKAMLKAISGGENVALGASAMEGDGSMSQNTAVGFAALLRKDAVSSDYIAANTSIGQLSLPRLNNGENNSALGSQALPVLQSGNNNIGIGVNAGSNLEGGENNILIGSNTTTFSSTTKNELNIGNWIVGVNGTIGIGTFAHPLPYDGIAQDGEKYKLFVKDGIKTEKIKVDIAANNGWADYVFKKDYQLRTLTEVEHFINKNGHLPEVPTTEEAIKNGMELKEMNILLLKKVEELTLYSIGQQKRIEALEQQMDTKN